MFIEYTEILLLTFLALHVQNYEYAAKVLVNEAHSAVKWCVLQYETIFQYQSILKVYEFDFHIEIA